MWLARTFAALGLVALATVALASGAVAEHYPSRTVTLVVPYPAGGLSDVVARAVARDLQERLGQPVIVENRVGGSGTIGAAYVTHAAPDGYTLLVNAAADVTNLHYMHVPYDILADFTPIAMMVEGPPLVLVAQTTSAYKSVSDLMAGAKANPGKLTFGSSGQGSSPAMAIALVRAKAHVDVIEVPYRGNSHAGVAVMAGEIDAAFVYQGGVKALADQGKVRALAITSTTRSPVWPQLPTMIECGFTGFEINGFVGLAAPAKTPPEIVALINRHVREIVSEPAFRERFAATGMQPRDLSPDEFATYLKERVERNGVVARLSQNGRWER